MAESESSERYFGRVAVRATTGEMIDQPVEAIVYAANGRGMMEAGSPGSIRLVGGAEVEREAMTLAPHRIGTVFLTSSGRLKMRGIDYVMHLVLSGMLGEPPRREYFGRTLTLALELAEQHRIRSIAIPLLGATTDSNEDERREAAETVVDVIVSHLRRTSSRLDSIVVVSRFADDQPVISAAMERARRRSWVE
jgi:O-acetyl-ADP-ribose deacetylase (regulator of RNase III)